MQFRTAQVEIDGDTFTLRELSGLSIECAQAQGNDARQGYALIALSLVGGPDGYETPIYEVDAIEDGLAFVMGLPTRITQRLTEAVASLNAASMDDARKN